MLALSSAVGYINEPFNPFHQPGICVARFPKWFQYVHAYNEHQFLALWPRHSASDTTSPRN
jgi:hypothetical protein